MSFGAAPLGGAERKRPPAAAARRAQRSQRRRQRRTSPGSLSTATDNLLTRSGQAGMKAVLTRVLSASVKGAPPLPVESICHRSSG